MYEESLHLAMVFDFRPQTQKDPSLYLFIYLFILNINYRFQL